MLFVQPSKLLIDRTVKGLGVPARKIHSNLHPNTTVRKATEWMQDPKGMAFITQQCYDQIRCNSDRIILPARRHITAVFDEVPPIVRFFERRMRRTKHLITDFLDCVPVDDGSYSLLAPKDSEYMEKLLKEEEDDFWMDKKDLLGALLSGHWNVHVETEQYARLLNGRDFWLRTYAVRRPDSFAGFRNTMFAGACMTETMFYRKFSRDGIKFRRREDLSQQLRPGGDPSLIQLHPMVIGPWSKAIRDSTRLKQLLGDDPEDAYREHISDRLERFLFLTNKDRLDLFEDNEVSRHLPQSMYGLNQYQGYNNAVIYMARNLTPAQSRFCMSPIMGMSEDEIRVDTMYIPVLQAGMRTSARNPENNDIKEWHIPDVGCAVSISRWMPGVNVHKSLFNISAQSWGRPRIHATSRERLRQHRRRKAKMQTREVGRPKKWNNKAERQRQYRKRKNTAHNRPE